MQKEESPPMAKEDFPVTYANLVQITHGAIEFLVDFKRLGPEAKKASEASPLARIVLHPVVAKSLRDALVENVAKYEAQFGEIPAFSKTPPRDDKTTLH
jgi:hypothetical protein